MKIQNIKIAVEELKRALVAQFGSGVKLVMFGSAARGDSNIESDIDLLVLVPCAVNEGIEEQIISIAYDIELSLDVVFGIIVHSREFWGSGRAAAMPLYKNIEREGREL